MQKTKSVALILGVLTMSFLVGYLAFAWTEPTAPPPGGNVPAPLNVGSVGQSKAGGLILNTGGASIGLIVDKGNVGIGTTAPGDKLTILPVNNKGLTIRYSNDTGDAARLFSDANTGYMQLFNTNNTGVFFSAWSGAASYINAGNVGIGTTNPGAKLEVVGNIIASTNTHDSCTWTAWTCADLQTCSTGLYMAGIERGANSGAALCGWLGRQWYQMRIYCCQI